MNEERRSNYIPHSGLSNIYVNAKDKIFDRYKMPKRRDFRECPYEQWKDYFIADHCPNLSENVINEPVECPLTGEMEFLKVSLLTVLSFGEISDNMAERIRGEANKAMLTGQSLSGKLRELVLEEIKLGNNAIINKLFKSAGANNGKEADTWWEEAGIKEKSVDMDFHF
ncbi:MAG: hypothetical protein K5989_04545 [Lachnospiraceae bacterium]|nr:hypothetical protein [Lachnospiraceae bacterium]